MPLIPNLSLYLIQKFDRLALWGNLTILELHFAETQDWDIINNNLSSLEVSTILRGSVDSMKIYWNGTTKNIIGPSVKSLRKRRNLTQKALAVQLQ